MNESEFHSLVDETFEDIQGATDNCDIDIDCEEVGGVLTLEFENRSKLIFSRQLPLSQLWLAARSGGFHFDYIEDMQSWVCDSGDREALYPMLDRLASEQSGESVMLGIGVSD